MASPVSFGDVVAMAKLARTIALAFTKGRKSAPAEFREVENQLYSLSTALAAFQDAAHNSSAELSTLATSQQPGDRTVAEILSNCHETLSHLEKIVDKYGRIAEQQDPTKPRLQRWSQALIKNYKKIAWTTEAGDLAALRSQLMIHTNSLDLVLGIIINSRTARIEDSLKLNSDKLNEIHAWWEQNLKNSAAQPAQAAGNAVGTTLDARIVTFEVHIETGNGMQLLCSEACLRDDWRENGSSQLFSCRCRQNGSGRGVGSDHWKLEKIGLSPISFPFRQVGDTRAWTIYKTIDHSNNKLVSVVIKNVPVADITEFEESFIETLSEARAGAMLRQGVSNMLVHLSPDAQTVRILDLKSDIGSLYKLIDVVVFTSGHRNLTKSDINGLSLLHYRELHRENDPRRGLGIDYAELLIHYDEQASESPSSITRSEIRLKRNTTIKVKDGTQVVLNDIECLAFAGDDEKSRTTMSRVTFQMTTTDGAQKLHQKLEELRMELFVLSLQYPRSDETVALHLQVTQVQCEQVFILDAEMMIMRNQKNEYRLIISSRNGCTILSQELPETFFTESNVSGNGSSKFGNRTWLVQLEGEGVRRVYHYPKGFKFLNFHSIYAERMFELGRIAVSQATTFRLTTDAGSEQ